MDIVARDRGTLVFVEVKARETRDFGQAAEAVTGLKQRRIVRLARDYLTRHRLGDCACRFDVVAVHFEDERPAIEVFENAFDAA